MVPMGHNQKLKESGCTGENLFLALTDVCIKLMFEMPKSGEQA